MIVVAHTHRYLRFPKQQAVKVVRTVFRSEGVKNVPNISVVFTDDVYITKINKRFLNHNDTTDVIAFSLIDEMSNEAELYINLDAGRRQAKEYNVTYQNEVKRLLIHGTLHLIGYTDSTQKHRAYMKQKEEWYLKRI
ncbi:MAG: rRNA maturation RNase YbeY [Bacteroidetes bacterium]|nr:rRNA maturation RNase YbeY [Bacteroidota bacterium]